MRKYFSIAILDYASGIVYYIKRAIIYIPKESKLDIDDYVVKFIDEWFTIRGENVTIKDFDYMFKEIDLKSDSPFLELKIE